MHLHPLGLGVLILAAIVAAPDRVAADAAHDVDLALVLAVDVSSSMNEAEQRAQREGYVRAFHDPDVLSAIGSGPRGRIAVAYLEWAGPGFQSTRVPWAVISGDGDAAAFADRLAAIPYAVQHSTSISAALLASVALLMVSPPSDRDVIDLSGDGPNNAGPALDAVQAWVAKRGVTTNGLAIALPRNGEPDQPDPFGAGFVAAYYEHCVIGGPGAFVIPVDDMGRFGEAIREKLVLEIAGAPPRLIPVRLETVRKRAPVDCAAVGPPPGR